MKRVIAYSGGKDSTALLCFAKYNDWDFEAVFCDTGWEHPLTYAYIESINQRLCGGKLVTIKSEKYAGGMVDLVAKKGRVPSAKARFCTEALKVLPMIAWLKAQNDEITLYQGIRAEESPARAALPRRQWSDDYDCWIERPLLDWTVQDVWNMLRQSNIEPNPLYLKGAGRVGCFPCIMITHGELKRLTITMPEVWDRIAELELAAGRSFFPPNYIPVRFHSGRGKWNPVYDELPDGELAVVRVEQDTFPTVDDVKRYLADPNTKLFPDEPTQCMSIYNLCE